MSVYDWFFLTSHEIALLQLRTCNAKPPLAKHWFPMHQVLTLMSWSCSHIIVVILNNNVSGSLDAVWLCFSKCIKTALCIKVYLINMRAWFTKITIKELLIVVTFLHQCVLIYSCPSNVLNVDAIPIAENTLKSAQEETPHTPLFIKAKVLNEERGLFRSLQRRIHRCTPLVDQLAHLFWTFF